MNVLASLRDKLLDAAPAPWAIFRSEEDDIVLRDAKGVIIATFSADDELPRMLKDFINSEVENTEILGSPVPTTGTTAGVDPAYRTLRSLSVDDVVQAAMRAAQESQLERGRIQYGARVILDVQLQPDRFAAALVAQLETRLGIPRAD